jgi:hypothetical protein
VEPKKKCWSKVDQKINGFTCEITLEPAFQIFGRVGLKEKRAIYKLDRKINALFAFCLPLKWALLFFTEDFHRSFRVRAKSILR